MRSVCYNPLAYLDNFCIGCQFTNMCECDLRMTGGKPPEKKNKKVIAEKIVEQKVKQVVHNKAVNKFDIDI